MRSACRGLSVLAVVVIAASCSSGSANPTSGEGLSPITQPRPTFAPLTTIGRPTASTTIAPSTMPTAPPLTALPSTVDALLAQLVVAPEAHADTYERALFAHWIDADGDGCHTRCEVLEAERRASLPGLSGGGWLSIYDGYTTDDPSELEVDHVVALAEAWRSGAHAWDDERRRAFANDLDEPGALIAVTSTTNQAKRDKDPAEWQPSSREAWCEWGLGWLRTKVRWALSADEAETRALANVLRAC